MASAVKTKKYRLPFILVMTSFILRVIWTANYSFTLILTALIIPAILPLALLLLHKVRIKWLHAIFAFLCTLTLAVSALYAIAGFLSVAFSFSFIPLTYMSYFQASYVLMNLYRLLMNMIYLIPLVADTLILIALLMTTRQFHVLSGRR